VIMLDVPPVVLTLSPEAEGTVCDPLTQRAQRVRPV
jgi:hypothetical protein